MVLVEIMGCLSEHQDGTNIVTCPQGWDDLASEFKVKSLMEIDTTQFKSKFVVWCVYLGGNQPEGFKCPSQIVQKFTRAIQCVLCLQPGLVAK